MLIQCIPKESRMTCPLHTLYPQIKHLAQNETINLGISQNETAPKVKYFFKMKLYGF